MQQNTSPERSGWRDLSLSQLHREWGVECPATDIDLLVEAKAGYPIAIVEYKRRDWGTSTEWVQSKSNQIVRRLARAADVAYIAVHYRQTERGWLFCVKHSEGPNTDLFPTDTVFNEIGFVKALYAMRGHPISMVDELPRFRGAK
jgi:hypothetical protein